MQKSKLGLPCLQGQVNYTPFPSQIWFSTVVNSNALAPKHCCMKRLLTMMFLSVAISCHNDSQIKPEENQLNTISPVAEQDIDSLRRYSYPLMGLVGESVATATCFFIRANQKLYLVTAEHVFTSEDEIEKVQLLSPDTLYLRVMTKQSKEYDFIPIDVTTFKKNINKKHFYEEPDLLFYEIKLDDKYEINSLEGYMIENNLIGTYDAIFYGFPFNNQQINDRNDYMTRYRKRPSIKTLGFTGLNINGNIKWDIGFDSINYPINVPIDFRVVGCSGSPVFLRKDNKIIFGGVVIQGRVSRSWALAVRPKYVYGKYRLLMDGER